mmetsp:Transcript_11620/g.21300  ORF Transcript_11620/g.21300 Transcript_11620/m.21300 type:complete len:338 (+) Transcript_11620:60-1073(+)|eukprot:CAMPEP_0197516950 /NCGR_PEP_ID=MMETSP1318-20131121/1914_1 /TAXON_ID=552666 /ORGANISM="Partenskyella glossopodia, Strain RCC365" /LENGTH=337 /DNA_ID=CAMNT_0043066123 /DNA_START=30 /DNA_END=1043 /DNA_ORIENTATION=-
MEALAALAALRAAYIISKTKDRSTSSAANRTGKGGGEIEVQGRVLSISSSVVYGYVGNKASTFPMQLHGFDVDPINSVQLSNHTGYRYFLGQKLEGKDLSTLLQGLSKNELTQTYSHLMTGYLGTASFVNCVARLVSEMKLKRPGLQYICDPVMGDDGRLYVPEEFVNLYREKLIPHASLLTPNQSEAEWLSGETISCLDSAYRAAVKLCDKGAKNVVITSLQLDNRDDFIDVVAVGESIGVGKYYHLALPRQPGKYSGCGDLCTALLLVWFHKHPKDMKLILENTFASIQAVIYRTRTKGVRRCGWTELQLVNSRDDLESPQVKQKVQVIEAAACN